MKYDPSAWAKLAKEFRLDLECPAGGPGVAEFELYRPEITTPAAWTDRMSAPLPRLAHRNLIPKMPRLPPMRISPTTGDLLPLGSSDLGGIQPNAAWTARGNIIRPNFGIFFETINQAGEGGLYAELVLNLDFEITTLPQ